MQCPECYGTEPLHYPTCSRLTAPTADSIESTLAERGSRYGSFIGHADITQQLKAVMHDTPNWEKLHSDQKECLEMVAHKVGRILNGDPTYLGSWVDIVGYCTLVTNRLQGIIK